MKALNFTLPSTSKENFVLKNTVGKFVMHYLHIVTALNNF